MAAMFAIKVYWPVLTVAIRMLMLHASLVQLIHFCPLIAVGRRSAIARTASVAAPFVPNDLLVH
jgi:hypothetical protein